MRRLLAAVLVGMLLAPFGAVAAPSCLDGAQRQTSDPMSPICNSTWSGSNGGSTYQGVTTSRIDVVLYNDLGISGDLTKPWMATDETAGHLGDPSGVTTNLVRTAKALVAHFNSRYQTYGRIVRVHAYPSTLGETALCSARHSDVETAINAYQPFAVATVGAVHGCVFRATKEAGIVGLGLAMFANNADVAQGSHAYTFAPTLEHSIDQASSFICASLANKPAIYAGTPMTGATRRFGLIYQSTDPWISETAVGLRSQLLSKCALSLTTLRSYGRGAHHSLAGHIAEASRTAATNMPVTTMICLCPAPARDAHVAVAAARALGYLPEWFWMTETRIDRATVLRELADPLGKHFGISPTWMAPQPSEQQSLIAALDGDPGLVPNTVVVTDLFVTLRLLFTAVQLAGPNLTPASVDTGLQGFSVSPTGEGVAGGFPSTRPQYWTSTYIPWWFHATDEPPGGFTSRGCLRLPGGTARYAPSTWPATDAGFSQGACSGDLYRKPTDAPLAHAQSATR